MRGGGPLGIWGRSRHAQIEYAAAAVESREAFTVNFCVCGIELYCVFDGRVVGAARVDPCLGRADAYVVPGVADHLADVVGRPTPGPGRYCLRRDGIPYRMRRPRRDGVPWRRVCCVQALSRLRRWLGPSFDVCHV